VAVKPLAKIGSASGRIAGVEMQMRGAFDLGVRRKPQPFAADAEILGGLWILNTVWGPGKCVRKP